MYATLRHTSQCWRNGYLRSLPLHHSAHSSRWRGMSRRIALASSSKVTRKSPLLLHEGKCIVKTRNLALTPSEAQRQTIYALATPPGRGGVAVIRISGPQALDVYRRMVRTTLDTENPSPQKLSRCTVVDPATGEELDDGLAVFFKAPRSFTTEDVLELHVHSGRAIISAILSALASLSSLQSDYTTSSPSPLQLRPAQPGEFTRRAFRGGRIDLTQAEALNDIINANTDVQRRIAHSAGRGKARRQVEDFRSQILDAMAMVEAVIDFGEDQNLDGNDEILQKARDVVSNVLEAMEGHLKNSWRGEVLRSGLRVPIYGPPNAGKSTLFNALVGRDAAIVTHVPGTTRDLMEVTIDVGGMAVIVADTAGLHETEDLVEQIGIERARDCVEEARFSLCVLSLPEVVGPDGKIRVPEAVEELHVAGKTFYVLNKADLVSASDVERAIEVIEGSLDCCGWVWAASASSGRGVEGLLGGLEGALRARLCDGGEILEADPLITNARQREHIETAARFLRAFLGREDVVVAAEELRYAAVSVGRVTGVIDVDEVLDRIFRSFCIGK